MNPDIYASIRTANRIKYGTAVGEYGRTLLSDLYSDRTHFLYELVQNAEDACHRAAIDLKERGPFKISFSLFKDKLEVRHNGIPFTKADIVAICGIVAGTKQSDPSQIGKFGIGFKSVYAFTDSPQVYSGEYSFTIKNYVLPEEIAHRKDVLLGETLFVIPFNHSSVSQAQAYREIEAHLPNLGLRTLLFIKRIQEISWRTATGQGNYVRLIEPGKQNRIVLASTENGKPKAAEKWLVFSAVSKVTEDHRLEIAYRLTTDQRIGREMITKEIDSKLFAFFETQKETHLGFLIHGQYHTTPARDNIHLDDFNRNLIEQTAKLVSESIPMVKSLGMLDVSFLNSLPIRSEYFVETEFELIYASVKEKLRSAEALLPTDSAGFVSARDALLGRGKEFRNIVSSEQIGYLLRRKNSRWLDDEISNDKTPDLRRYLMQEIGVEEVDPERFARLIDDLFMSIQSNEWVARFYAFLIDQRALWKRKYYGEEEGPIRSKPIVRLSEGTHTMPFDAEGKPLAYLPSRNSDLKSIFPTVSPELASDQKARQFLEELGLKPPDNFAAILDRILPLYAKNNINPKSSPTNKQHVVWIAKTVEESKHSYHERKTELMSKVKSTPFLFARNIVSGAQAYKKPLEVYASSDYTGNTNIENFLDGNNNVWLLSDRYVGTVSTDELGDLGCQTKIRVRCAAPNWEGHVILTDQPSQHQRGMYGFDPNSDIDGLDYALQHITIERVKVIWNLLLENPGCIYGEIEFSTRKDFSAPSKTSEFSKLGVKLTTNSWLPCLDGKFRKPLECMLEDLQNDLDKTSSQVQLVAQKLQFKVSEEAKLLSKLPEARRAIYERLRVAGPDTLEKINRILQAESVHPASAPSANDFRNKMEDGLYEPSSSSQSPDQGHQATSWTGITLEEAEKIRGEFGKNFQEKLEKSIEQVKEKVRTSEITDSEKTSQVKQYLLEQYDGNCQVCNTRLDLGPNKTPYFDVFRIIEAAELKGWTEEDFNVISLCPNCHALAKHGGHDFRQIVEKAREVSKGLAAPEEVRENSGDYYIVQIVLAGKEAKIFYTPGHMAKFQAFLDFLDKGGDNIG